MATVLFKKYIYSIDIWFFSKKQFLYYAEFDLGPSLESWVSKILNHLTQLHAFTYTYCKKNTWIIVKKIFCKKNIRSNFSSHIYKEN
jgi:hypothetical protein